ncbi:MAG: CCA-adding enzyme [Chlamydiales bacterium]|nr:CCA-adding enzyme [Chlamydiales bacterium]
MLLQSAKSICQTLFDAGYTAYIAGGWVRDLLLNEPSDEIDIATSAPPSKIQELFEKTIPVGIAFGVVIVVYQGFNFEITTFRKDHPYQDGRHPDGVDFSTPEKDAERRDFTINGMFYDPLNETIHDYVEGREDLKKGVIRAIGDPKKRFEEDRLRMIRAVRFATRFNFEIESQTQAAIHAYASTVFPSVSIERVWQELNKMARSARFGQAMIQLHTFGLLQVLFAHLKDLSKDEIETRVQFFPYFPLNCPLILYLLELFPDYTHAQKINLCRYLKATVKDRKLVDFFSTSHEYTESYEWAYFYAHPLSKLFLEIQAAKKMPSDKQNYIEEHQQRAHQLQIAIQRIENKTPLVTAAHLQAYGINPGKQMGELLKKAERIAINEGIQTAELVIKRLGLPKSNA